MSYIKKLPWDITLTLYSHFKPDIGAGPYALILSLLPKLVL